MASIGCTASPEPPVCNAAVEAAIVSLESVPSQERLSAFEGRIEPACRASDAYRLGRSALLVDARRINEAEALLLGIEPGSPAFGRALRARFLLVVELRTPGAKSTAEAHRIAETYARNFPKDYRTPLFAGVVAARSGDPRTAVRLYDEARQMLPASHRNDFDVWEVHFLPPMYDMDRYEDVVRILDKQRAGDPDFWMRADFVLIGIYSMVQVGRVDDAAAMLAQLLEVNPAASEARIYAQVVTAIASARSATSPGDGP